MALPKNFNIEGNITASQEQLETNKLKLTISVSAEFFRYGLTDVYNKNKGYFNVPGFRKGRAPRKIIEQMYGRDIFHEEALGVCMPEAYITAVEQLDIDPVYMPDVETGEMDEKTGAVFYAVVYVRPTATIEGYLGLTYPKTETEATEEDIQNALREEQEKNARQVSIEGPAKEGDIVTMNFKGYMDGELFDGGEGEDYDLTLGSGQFIPGFEEQLIGKIPGDDVNVEVTFPEDYHHEDYAGKLATFEVEVLDVKSNELPELDDEFASDISEFDTMAEYREDLASTISENKKKNAESTINSHLIEQLIVRVEADIPEAMYLGRIEDMYHDFKQSVQSRGLDVESYMRFTRLTEEGLKASWRTQAEGEVKASLALEAIANSEGYVVTGEEFKEKLMEAHKNTSPNEETIDKMIESMSKERRRDFERVILRERALEYVKENAVELDEPLVDAEGIVHNPDVIDVIANDKEDSAEE